MAESRTLNVSAGIVAAVVGLTALSVAAVVFEPLALAAFILAIVWPIFAWLKARAPLLIALAATLLLTVTVCLAVASMAAYAFGSVGRSLLSDTQRYQALFDSAVAWLEDHGISVAGVWAEHFSAGWVLAAVRSATDQLNSTLTFWLIALVYVMLGLLEIDDAQRKIEKLMSPEAGRRILDACAETALKFRKYMIVRTQMSVVTGVLVWILAWLFGLQFAAEWGVIAFVLNYIPFIGPFVATLFPTLLAMAQFPTWQSVLVLFLALNLVQFVIGSYVEPRVSGGALAMSPFLVFVAVFFWAFVWGLFGAFIGDPIVVAILTFCRHHPSTRALALFFGGPLDPAKG